MTNEHIVLVLNLLIHYIHAANAVGDNLMVAAVISAINRYRPLTKKLFVWSTIGIAASALLPHLLERCSQYNVLLACALALIVSIFISFAYIWILILPARVAKSRNHPMYKTVLRLNIIALVPFAWLVAFWMATRPQKDLEAAIAKSLPPRIIEIVNQAEAAAKTLEEAHFTEAGQRLRLAATKDQTGDKILVRLNQTVDRVAFDFELPENVVSELRNLAAEIDSAN